MEDRVLGIWGAGGLGREILELANIINLKEHRWASFVFIDDHITTKLVNGVEVLSYEEACNKYQNLEIVIGVGEPIIRLKLFEKLEKDNILSPTLIHPNVHIPETTTIGKGVVIQEGCFISCNVVIEDFVFLQPNVNVGHDDYLKKGCIISGLVNLSGHVTIGEFSYIGISTAIKQGVSIGNYCIVGMCSGVYKDIEDEMVAMGNPARPMKKNDDHTVFK